jgi:protein TonB
MPARAERSGFCRVILDVGADGTPFNVRATDCSESIFSRPTVRAVERWRYRPKVENGIEVTRQNVRNIVRFNLLDERGHLIPER